MICQYFARCVRQAVGLVRNPMVGDVPTCAECAERMEQTLLPFEK